MTVYTAEEIHKSIYGYLPDLPANAVGLAIFSLLLVLQIGQGLYYRQWWFAVSWWCGLILQVLGYVGRVISHYNLMNFEAYKMQLACLTISPAFLMAGIYYQLAKLTTVYGKQYSLLPPMGYSAVFIACDVLSILIQAAGGGIAAAGVDGNDDLSNTGSHIMLAGLAFQVASMLAFMIIFGLFIYKVWRDDPVNYEVKFDHIRSRPAFKYLVPALCVAVLLIFIRSVYRVAELSDGWTGHIIRTERYQLVCDGLMVLIACIALTAVYPGLALSREPIPVQGVHYKKEDLVKERAEMELASGEKIPSSTNSVTENHIPKIVV